MEANRFLGHATIDLTMRYVHLYPAVNRDGVKLLDMKSGTPSGTLTAPGPVA